MHILKGSNEDQRGARRGSDAPRTQRRNGPRTRSERSSRYEARAAEECEQQRRGRERGRGRDG
jgi:hypothetical protein